MNDLNTLQILGSLASALSKVQFYEQKSYEYNYADQHAAEFSDTIRYMNNSEG